MRKGSILGSTGGAGAFAQPVSARTRASHNSGFRFMVVYEACPAGQAAVYEYRHRSLAWPGGAPDAVGPKTSFAKKLRTRPGVYSLSLWEREPKSRVLTPSPLWGEGGGEGPRLVHGHSALSTAAGPHPCPLPGGEGEGEKARERRYLPPRPSGERGEGPRLVHGHSALSTAAGPHPCPLPGGEGEREEPGSKSPPVAARPWLPCPCPRRAR